MSLQLDYYYGKEAEQFSFYRLPKILFTDARFKGVSVEAKVLYGLLLDRMALSVRNSWLDKEGRVYIVFTVADIMETLGCTEQKANKLLNELDGIKGVGLIERVRRGLGKPNVIYVKNFVEKSPPHQEVRFQKCKNHKSGDVKTTNQEMRKSQTNNTDINNTDCMNMDLPIHPSCPERRDTADSFTDKNFIGKDFICKKNKIDKMDAYRDMIKENISYDVLLNDKPYDRERLDGFVELMAEICGSNMGSIRINQSDMSTEVVKSRFLKLNSEHIRYVMDCLDKNTTVVGNIRAYMLSALFNAPVTISQYYSSLVNHDFAHG